LAFGKDAEEKIGGKGWKEMRGERVEPGVCYTAIYVKQIKQIVSNFHRMFAYLCTISIQNFSCYKDKRFIVDFLSSKTRFSAQNANKVFGGPAPPEPARELPDP